jgi:dTMP kinase
MRQGKFIVIEGTDGSGKGTQLQLLKTYLEAQGKAFEMVDFPQYDHFSGAFVAKYLRGEYGSAKDVGPYRASLLYAIDRYDKSFDIKKWLKEGTLVLSNRYVSASMGHQAGKIQNKKKRDAYLSWLIDLEYRILNIPKPDMTILLYMPPEIGQQLVDNKKARKYTQGKKRDIHEADLAHLREASKAFLYVAKKYKWKVVECTKDGVLLSKEEIHRAILGIIKKYL